MQTIAETNKIIKSLKRTVINLEKRVANLENPSKPKLITYSITREGVLRGIDYLLPNRTKSSLKYKLLNL